MNELPALIEAFKNISLESVAVEYRLYYDDSGRPTVMSSSGFPESGNYITIDKEIYDRANYNSLRVIDGKLVIVDDVLKHVNPLKLSDRGTRVVKGHANIIVNETYQGETEHYAFKNH